MGMTATLSSFAMTVDARARFSASRACAAGGADREPFPPPPTKTRTVRDWKTFCPATQPGQSHVGITRSHD